MKLTPLDFQPHSIDIALSIKSLQVKVELLPSLFSLSFFRYIEDVTNFDFGNKQADRQKAFSVSNQVLFNLFQVAEPLKN